MTGNAFLKRLSFQLDFLNPDDKKIVLQYYENKLSAASTLTEEETLIRSFGAPDRIADRLREAVSEMAKRNTKKDVSVEKNENNSSEMADRSASATDCEETSSEQPTEESKPVEEEAPLEEATHNESPSTEESASDGKEEGDVIFSKPLAASESAEIVQSMENKEVKTLYGEKVVIEEKTEPIPVYEIETPAEGEPTPEEVELAKAQTLQKAKNYNTASFGVPEVNAIRESPEWEENAPKEKNEQESDLTDVEENAPIEANAELEDIPLESTKEYKGIFPAIFSKLEGKKLLCVEILLSIVLLPALILLFGAVAILYAVAVAAITLLAVVLFLIMVFGVLFCVFEMFYGISILFQSVAAALIEIGVGIIFLAIITAVCALIYEYLFGVFPRFVKYLTRFFIQTVKKLFAVIYGGRA